MDFAGSRCVGSRGERSAVDHGCVVFEPVLLLIVVLGRLTDLGDQIEAQICEWLVKTPWVE